MGRSVHRLGYIAAGCAALLLSMSPLHAAAPTVQDALGAHWGVFGKYCAKCHNTTDWAGGIAFETMSGDAIADDADIWEKAVRKLRGHLMPPPGNSRPDARTVNALLGALTARLDAAARAHPQAGKVGPHRLNRAEYANAIEDILGLRIDPELYLPKDVTSEGFDDIAAVLQVSPTFIDQFVTAADILTTQAVGDPDVHPQNTVYRAADTANQNHHLSGLPFGTRGGLSVEHDFPADGDYVFDINGLAGNTYVWGVRFPDKVILTLDGRQLFAGELGGEQDLKAAYQTMEPAVKKINARFRNIRRYVTAGPHRIGVAFIAKSAAESDEVLQSFVPDAGLPRLARVDSLDITGPFNPRGVGNTPSRRKIFICHPTRPEEELPCATRILAKVAREAFRQPVTAADLSGPLAFYKAGRDGSGGSFDSGIQQGLMAILSSPRFLYRIDTPPQPVEPGTAWHLTDLQLASRLAFFLWSRPPDEQLLTVAAQGRLHEPKVLEEQIARMLADPRSHSLVTNFAFGWLEIPHLDQVIPDATLFPGFDEDLRDAFERELELFIGSVFDEDRSVVDLLTANYTFVNRRLALFYGIKSVGGERFQRVTLKDPRRFGLLGKGAVLMTTSYGNRTSPVLRGAYILERIIGAPPNPPPPNIATFPETKAGEKALTVRARLEAHRRNPSCRACHAVMDPMGLALENFNAIGKWRSRDRDAGLPIDAAGSMVDGTQLRGPNDLRQALAAHPEQFAQTFTEKLLTFALGRRLKYYDMPTVRRIVREAARHHYRFSDIVQGVVQSDEFQMQQPPAAKKLSGTKSAAL